MGIVSFASEALCYLVIFLQQARWLMFSHSVCKSKSIASFCFTGCYHLQREMA
jgi:hypothetical protein